MPCPVRVHIPTAMTCHVRDTRRPKVAQPSARKNRWSKNLGRVLLWVCFEDDRCDSLHSAPLHRRAVPKSAADIAKLTQQHVDSLQADPG
jgi:hypothetical protein